MDRANFVASCRRRAIQIALEHTDPIKRPRALWQAETQMLVRAAELGIDGAEAHDVLGHSEELGYHSWIEPAVPRDLREAIAEAFGGEDLMAELTGHGRIRLMSELRRFDEVA